MIQDISTKYGHKDNLTRGLSPCEAPTSTDFVANEVAARCQRSGGSSPAKWRLVMSLFLMLFVGVCGVKAGDGVTELPFRLSTTDGDKYYYMLQSVGLSSFYMVPKGTYVHTLQIPSEDFRWYFVDASSEGDEEKFFYIVSKGGKYLCHNSDGGYSVLKDAPVGDRDKFYLAQTESGSSYYFVAKKKDSSNGRQYLNKKSGNVNVKLTEGIKLSSADDKNSQWNILPTFNEDGSPWKMTWNPPFTLSDESLKHYYNIQNVKNNTYYISYNSASPKYVKTTNTISADDYAWCFVQAVADQWITYYYIVNANGEYMYYRGDATQTSSQSNVANIQNKTAENEDRYQFIVVQAAIDGNTAYTIIPKLLKDNDWIPNTTTVNNNSSIALINTEGNVGTKKSRESGSTAYWFINSIDACDNPTIGFDIVTKKGTVSSETSDAVIYYTKAEGLEIPANPTTASTLYVPADGIPVSENAITTIKAIAIKDGLARSEVVTKTIVRPTITLSSTTHTYDGIAQTPVSSVDVGTTHYSETTDYNVLYKKEGVVVTECKDAGEYTIELTAADGVNDIIYASATFTINPKEVGLNWMNTSPTYTGTALTPTVDVNGLIGSDACTISTFSVSANEGSSLTEGNAINVGSYTATASTLSNTNYKLPEDKTHSFTITPAPVTVTADEGKTKVYGDDDPTLTATVAGMVNGESTSLISYSVSRANGEAVGTYAITLSGDASQGNYNVTYVDDNKFFTITPAEATVTVDVNQTKIYGDIDPVLTATVSGMKNGDAATVISYTVSRAEGETAGDYTIIPSGEAEQGNYTVNYVAGTFTISQKALTVTAKANEITYGDAPANDGVTYSGFIEGESENTGGMFTGTLSYVYSYSQYDDVGNTYTITPSGLTATNYAITFVAGTLTVNQRETDIEWGNTALGYNGSPQTPTATATNVVNNDEVTVTVTGAQTNVGTDYTATATGLTGTKAGNYVLVSSNTTTTFSIGTGTFTPTVSIDGWTFGEASNDPSVSGNMSGGDVTYTYSVKGENNYSTTVPTNVGDYTVKVTIAASGNYDSAEATKDFTISPKSIGDGKDLATDIDIKIEQDGDDVKVTYVKDGETTLVVDNDYSVSIDVQGEDKYVIVTGIGNYTGSAQGLFVMSVFTKPTGATEAASVYQASSDLAKPNDITPYIVRKVNPSIGTMVITPIDYIPKDVPVLMLRTGQATGFLASPKEDATAEITAQTKNSNLLKVAPEDGVGVEAAQVYMFYLGEFVLTKKGTISNGKFFLYNPNYTATPPAEEGGQQGGSGNAPSLSTLRFVIEEEPTGIVEMRNEKGEMRNGSDWFTLDGRKLNDRPTKPGLYIWNGRKTIIKRK